MEKLSFKTFVWPQNPHTYKEEWIRKAFYTTVDKETYFDHMGEMQRVITGKGTFFGQTAVSDFQRLAKLFDENSPGNLEHPQWGIRYCYFTGLELVQEPKEDCISYQFTFTQAKADGDLPV